jgi:ComEC/Rec2-related protein
LLNQIASEIDCTQNSELAKGLVVGGVNFNDDLKLAIKRTGLSHVVAVSGFQISLLVSALEILTNRIGMGRNLRLSLLVGSVLGLILLVGPQPPVLRASFSSLLSVGSLLIFGRRLETWRGMVYSGLIMLWLNPFYLFSYSFLLSFAATAGLVSLNYKFFVVNPLKLLIESGLVSLSAFLWTLPILSNLSGQTSPLSVLINLIIGPLIAPVTLVNILAWLPMVGDLFGFVGAVCLQFILKVVLLTSRILPIWSVKPFGIIESGLYLLIVWLAFKIAASIRLEKHLPQTNSVELSL